MDTRNNEKDIENTTTTLTGGGRGETETQLDAFFTERFLKWIEKQMGKSFLVKVVGKLGGDESDLKELCILNRVLRWTKNGITYEADPGTQNC